MAEIDVALPLPTGDPETLRTRTGHLDYASAAATQTVLAREAPAGLGLATVWAGPAHDAALAEAGTAARLINEVAGRFGPAAAAVRGFADALEIARRTVAALREEWLAADRHQAAAVHEHLPLATDPAAQAEVARAAAARRERCRSDLLTRYAACMSNLEAAETTAAHAVSGTLGEAVSPAGQRLLLLSQLPVSAVAARQAEAVALVDRVLSGVGTNPHGWSAQQIEQVVLALGDQLADPLVVRALMDRLGVDGLEHASRVLWHETDPMRTRAPTEGSDSARQALDLLARAFAGSVSEAPASDPASAALLDQWRAGWLGQLLSSTTSGLTAQLMLVSAAAAGPSRTVPGYGYAVGALRALLAGSGPLTPQFDLSGVYTNGRISADNLQDRDPYQLLLSSLGADPALARRVLLSEGTTGRTLLHELVVERPLQSASTADPLTSSAALGRLVLDLAEAPDSTSAAHAEFAGAFLDALGEAGQRWWDLGPQEAINVGRHLDALRQPGAVLLTADPARVHADAEAAQDGGSAQAARMRSLLGEITRDHDPTSGGLSAQSLRTLLEQLATFEARRLAQAMAAEPVNSDTVTNAQSRLGYVLGFTAEAATQAQIHAGEAEDALNRQQRELIGMSAEVISAAPLPGSGAVAKVAGVVGAVVVGLGAPALSDLYPVDNAELASNRRGPRVAEARALASQSARDALRDQFGSESARAAGLAASRAVEPGTDAVLTADSERDRAP